MSDNWHGWIGGVEFTSRASALKALGISEPAPTDEKALREGAVEIPCPTCKKTPHTDHLECANCGKRLPPGFGDYCPDCGNRLRDNDGTWIKALLSSQSAEKTVLMERAHELKYEIREALRDLGLESVYAKDVADKTLDALEELEALAVTGSAKEEGR